MPAADVNGVDPVPIRLLLDQFHAARLAERMQLIV